MVYFLFLLNVDLGYLQIVDLSMSNEHTFYETFVHPFLKLATYLLIQLYLLNLNTKYGLLNHVFSGVKLFFQKWLEPLFEKVFLPIYNFQDSINQLEVLLLRHQLVHTHLVLILFANIQSW